MSKIELHNCDCVEYMKTLPNNYFKLAICDPPYGIGEDGKSNHSRDTKRAPATKFIDKKWDKGSPDIIFFNELIRISQNQIIWGANHFISKIPFDSSCWIVWDKNNGATDFADCELAYTSFKTAVRKFTFTWNGYNQGYKKPYKEKRIHPTQKPVKLYEWILENYAKEGDNIFDSHLGSASSVIAAYNLGFDITGCELDKDYFAAANKRIDTHITQCSLLIEQPKKEIITQPPIQLF